ncbi:MAG: YARHG domain-containing protein [Chitinophagaceae bacterium]|nr:YARHG domain-containing protein [Chitinophagaceae bacterium]
MRKMGSLLLAGLFLLACNNEKKTDKPASDNDSAVTADNKNTAPSPPPATKALEEILGSFVGAFGDNKITLLITKAVGDSVIGRSIVGGNDRPFSGTFVFDNGIYTVSAKEPGDHKDDGSFSFTVSKANLNEISGSWRPNDTKRPSKTYTLQRKKFEYRTDVGTWPQSSQRLLKAKDVENYSKEELEFMRNEIFARHGYCFNRKHLRQQFEMEDWYVPNTVDIKGFLTDIEKKNIELIKRYEKYAEEYGDEYGR